MLGRTCCPHAAIDAPSQRRHLTVSPLRAPRVMHRYAAFGYTIESAIELPELEPATGDRHPDWQVSVGMGAPPTTNASFAADRVYGDVYVRAFALDDGLRLAFDDTGIFDIQSVSRRIVWYPGASVTDAAFRADLLGRVMALAAHVDGHLALHASAVSIGGRAVAFLGPKHAGKSTLALALVRLGARLLTDDSLIVRLDAGTAWAAPGVHRVRLWNDSARALGATVSDMRGAKPTVDRLAPNELETEPVPLDACYILEASPELLPGALRCERLSAVRGALAQMRFSKLGALAGGGVGAALLDRVASLTRTVPVLTATVGRDLTSLHEVAARFVAWRGSATELAGAVLSVVLSAAASAVDGVDPTAVR